MSILLYEKEMNKFLSRNKELNELMIIFQKHLDKIFAFLLNQDEQGDEGLKFLTLKDLHNYLIVMRLSLNCILNDSYLTKREIFYMNQNIFQKQSNLNLVIKQLSYDMQICRKELHIVSASKGLVCGALILKKNDIEIDLLSITFEGKGLNITEFMDEWIPIIYGQAILVVEKETIYFHLINERNLDFFQNVVLITGKGYPCNATKFFIKYLSLTNSQIPLYYFGDMDPHGYEILSQYTFGNDMNQHEQTNLPWIIWLNQLIQWNKINIKRKQSLQKRELLLLKGLLNNENIPTNWKQTMNKNEKFEIEDILIDSFSLFLLGQMVDLNIDII